MNHIFKIVWCTINQTWVVASELAKSSGKGKTSVSKTVLLISLIAISANTSVSAVEVCGDINGGVFTTDVTCFDSGNSAVNIENIEVTGDLSGYVLQNNNNVEGNLSATFSGNTKIESTKTTTDNFGSNGILVWSAKKGDANVKVEGNIDITINDSSNVPRFNLDGIEVSSNEGDATLIIDASGQISTNAGNAVYAGSTTTGNVYVSLNANNDNVLNIETSGLSNNQNSMNSKHGVSAHANKNGTGSNSVQVEIGKNVSISTESNFASGVYTTAAQGNIDIKNQGKIITNGKSSHGLYAKTSGNIDIENQNDITTKEDNSRAIYAMIDNVNSTGEISITNSGALTTEGKGSYGIYAQNNGTGAVTIVNKGDITTLDETGFGGVAPRESHAIIVDGINTGETGGTNIFVEDSKLQTSAYDSSGIRVLHRGSKGDTNIIVKNSTMNLNGANSDGVIVHQTNDAIDGYQTDINITTIGGEINLLQNPTDINASGGSNFGLVATQSKKAKGDINIINEGTAINIGLGGTGRTGRSGAIYATFDNTDATGSINIQNSGALQSKSSDWGVIRAAQNGSGDIKIINTGSILADGDKGNAIDAYISNINSIGEISITNSGNLTTQGNSAYGIFANSKGTGNIVVSATGSIKTEGSGAHGIYVLSEGSNQATTLHLKNIDLTSVTTGNSVTSSAYNVFINQKNKDASDINVFHENSNVVNHSTQLHGAGVYIESQSENGNINYNATNVNFDMDGNNADGINIANFANNSTGNIIVNTHGGSITTYNSNGNVSSNYGIVAQQRGIGAKGDITIINNGTKITTGKDTNDSGVLSDGIAAIFTDQDATGNINIKNSGDILTNALGRNRGIVGTHAGNGNINIENSGNITTKGDSSHGIFADNTGQGTVTIINQGDINTQGQDSSGIRVNGSSAQVAIQNSGDITTNGINAHGIRVDPADGQEVVIHNDGTLKLDGATSRGIIVRQTNANNTKITVVNNGAILESDTGAGKYGIEVNGLNNSNIEINHNGVIKGGGIGIVAWSGFVDHTGGTSIINIGSSGVVEAHNAITADMSKSNTVNIAHGGLIDAYNGGVLFRGQNSLDAQNNVLNNAGTILSDTDKVIVGHNLKANSITTINNQNSGVITGTMTFSDGNVELNNSGIWNLRSFTDTNGDRVRDTKNVAISDFGSGTNIINNTGIIKLAAVDDKNAIINTTGEYLPSGVMSSGNAGIEHGYLLGVKEFNHSGILDLRGSGLSGNLFVISGGNTAGVNGGGVFTSNGGIMNVTTLLNQGGADSRSDMLVADNIKLGSNATKIDVAIASGSQDVPTIDSGIQIVKTLATQDYGSFTLLKPVTYGRYEYLLFGDDGNGNADGYYLRNRLNNPGGSSNNVSPPVYLPNPNIGAYLGNQYAAANMFNQNILDRRDNVRAPDQTIWGRIQYNEMKTDHMDNTQKLSIDNTLIQLGADLYQDLEKGHIAGVYVGYGKSEVKNRSRLTGTEAKGSVEGLQIGAYYSWMPQEDQGPYVDIWGHYAHFTNKLKGDAQRGLSKKYNGYGLALSAETGYGFVLSEDASKKWILEPHAQITYNYVNMDSFTDHNNTRFSENKGKGFDLRLGARLYGYHPENDGLLPYVELNWLYNDMSNDVRVNGSKEQSRIGKNVGELKLGFQGNLSKESSVFAHVGYEKGSNRYHRTKFQIGFNYNW